MKRLLFLALIYFPFALGAIAQSDTAWTKSQQELYGTRTEKQRQRQVELVAGDYRAILIGYKQFYANQISMYLQSRMDYSVQDMQSGPTFDKYIFTKNGVFSGGAIPKPLVVTYQ